MIYQVREWDDDYAGNYNEKTSFYECETFEEIIEHVFPDIPIKRQSSSKVFLEKYYRLDDSYHYVEITPIKVNRINNHIGSA